MKKIIGIIGIIAISVLIFSTISPYISPSKTSIIPLFGLFYLYILGVNILLLFFLLLVKHNFFWLNLFVIISSLVLCSQFYALNFIQSKENYDFKITSYNVRLFDKYNWINKKGKTKFEIYKFLKDVHSDIYCIQEFDNQNNLEFELKKMLATPYSFFYKKNRKSNNGIIIFSKYPILKKGSIVFSNSKLNNAIWVDLKLKSDTIRVYNFHLASIRLSEKDKNYEIQKGKGKRIYRKLINAYTNREVQVLELLDHSNNSPFPTVFCGDLNDTPVSYAYKKISKDKKDAFLESGFGFGSTYTGKIHSSRIDYIFIPRNFETLGFNIQKSVLSDHRAITSQLKIRD